MTHEDYLKQAKDLGAVSMRIFRIEKFLWGVDTYWFPFSYHFFNVHDVEICYYIEDLIGYPMKIFQEPREWSEEFKNNPAYELIDLKLIE
jgi:hypothetical protein